MERLVEEPRIRKALDLEEVPHPTTLVKAFERLETKLWRVFLQASAELLEKNGTVGVDASGFERNYASRHYTKRTKLHIKELKTTLLVDTEENAILDVHITASRKHDTQIGSQLVKRASKFIEILLGDKGYDDQDLRKLCHELGIRPLIKHREFSNLHKAWNVLLDDDLYGQRNQNESVNSTIGRKYDNVTVLPNQLKEVKITEDDLGVNVTRWGDVRVYRPLYTEVVEHTIRVTPKDFTVRGEEKVNYPTEKIVRENKKGFFLDVILGRGKLVNLRLPGF